MEKRGVRAQHLSAAPKDKARIALRTPCACHALDNSADRRYERALVEDA